jgi:hypothetical protein
MLAVRQLDDVGLILVLFRDHRGGFTCDGNRILYHDPGVSGVVSEDIVKRLGLFFWHRANRTAPATAGATEMQVVVQSSRKNRYGCTTLRAMIDLMIVRHRRTLAR